MNKPHYVANALLWAAAILSSAAMGSASFYTLVLLPLLAGTALLLTYPASPRAAICDSRG